jgi:hypothetical protein
MEKILDHFLGDIHHIEGWILYIAGAITITKVQIRYAKEYVQGLKGPNTLFEAPEILLHLFNFLWPHILMQQFFLVDTPSVYAWMFLAVLVLFGLTGRWGLEWLAAMKNGTSVKEFTVENNKTKITETETKDGLSK